MCPNAYDPKAIKRNDLEFSMTYNTIDTDPTKPSEITKSLSSSRLDEMAKEEGAISSTILPIQRSGSSPHLREIEEEKAEDEDEEEIWLCPKVSKRDSKQIDDRQRSILDMSMDLTGLLQELEDERHASSKISNHSLSNHSQSFHDESSVSLQLEAPGSHHPRRISTSSAHSKDECVKTYCHMSSTLNLDSLQSALGLNWENSVNWESSLQDDSRINTPKMPQRYTTE